LVPISIWTVPAEVCESPTLLTDCTNEGRCWICWTNFFRKGLCPQNLGLKPSKVNRLRMTPRVMSTAEKVEPRTQISHSLMESLDKFELNSFSIFSRVSLVWNFFKLIIMIILNEKEHWSEIHLIGQFLFLFLLTFLVKKYECTTFCLKSHFV
jgi:hypothetical protein